MIHCKRSTEASRLLRMDGSATLTMVLSIPTISRLEQQMASTSILRRELGSVTRLSIHWADTTISDPSRCGAVPSLCATENPVCRSTEICGQLWVVVVVDNCGPGLGVV